jgi:hypothetical protein
MSDVYDELAPLVEARAVANPWDDDKYAPDYELLTQLTTYVVAAGATQASGRFAKAIDFWVAHEFRRAGFDPDAVWPRADRPRVLTRELALLVDRYVPAAGREALGTFLADHSAAKTLAPKDAKVLGRVYLKQADVLMAHWSRGAELLVSTKTMLSSYGKNLRNRFEESYGDSANLRGRHPLCALGFLFVVRSDIPKGDLNFLWDMLGKLTGPADGYDAVCLLVVDWDDDGNVAMVPEKVPEDLSAEAFFAQMVEAVLDRTPTYLHVEARERREHRDLDLVEGEADQGDNDGDADASNV